MVTTIVKQWEHNEIRYRLILRGETFSVEAYLLPRDPTLWTWGRRWMCVSRTMAPWQKALCWALYQQERSIT